MASNLEPVQRSQYTLRYGLDDRGIVVRFPTDARDFSLLLSAQIGYKAHPFSYSMITRRSPESSAEVKMGGAILHSSIHVHGVNTGIIVNVRICKGI
jgi:hypothetical protein